MKPFVRKLDRVPHQTSTKIPRAVGFSFGYSYDAKTSSDFPNVAFGLPCLHPEEVPSRDNKSEKTSLKPRQWPQMASSAETLFYLYGMPAACLVVDACHLSSGQKREQQHMQQQPWPPQ